MQTAWHRRGTLSSDAGWPTRDRERSCGVTASRARALCLALLLPLLSLPWAAPAAAHGLAAPPRYTVSDLGTLPGQLSSWAWGVNAAGAVNSWLEVHHGFGECVIL